MCLSHNGVNFTGSPLRLFDPALFTWNGLADAWQDQGISAAAADNFTVPDFFNKLTLWGGFGIGSYSSSSCTVFPRSDNSSLQNFFPQQLKL